MAEEEYSFTLLTSYLLTYILANGDYIRFYMEQMHA
jgi:hypothetical protein